MISTPHDYLKFWKVIRYYMKAKHGLTQGDLDMILFLYTEGYFNKDRFTQFDELLAWDISRFERLRQNGWLEVFRRRSMSRKALYQISDKGKNLCRDIYRKLNGEEIPTSTAHNPMFKKNVSYSDKVYRNMIKSMNEFIKQQRHQTHE